MNTERRCVVSSRHPDPEKTPRAVNGLMTCAGHTRKVERMIAELPELYDDLGAALTASERHDKDSGRQKGGAKVGGVSLNEPVLEARAEIHDELRRLALYVSDERGMNPPGEWRLEGLPFGVLGPRRLVWQPRDDVPTLTSWLQRHAEWLCARPDADETHDNLDRLVRDCHSLAFPSGRRRFVLPEVVCGSPLMCDVETQQVIRCDGQIVALLMPDDDRENLSELSCETCGLEVPMTAAALPDHWMHAA